MLKIRSATPADIARAEYICIQTADEKLKSNARRARITALLFSTYYIRHESRNCFVLTDEEKVVGYILCCTDLRGFLKSYRGDIFKEVCKLSPLWGVVCLFIPVKYALLQKRYPAHLHIDILEPYQSSGYGSRLMQALLTRLKAQGCGACAFHAVRRIQERFTFMKNSVLKAFLPPSAGR